MKKTLSLHLYTNKSSSSLQLEPITPESQMFYFQLVSIFGELDGDKLQIPAVQQMDKNLRNSISNFVDSVKGNYPVINRFQSNLNKVKDGEYFIILPNRLNGTKEIINLYSLLDSLNEASSLDQVREVFTNKKNNINELFSELLDSYDVYTPIVSKRFYIGQPKKDKRCCRFCKRKESDGATFRKVAHAIPEALGNKNIILYDECDCCNGHFGDNIEEDIINYLEIYRVFYGVKGKNGTPKIKYQNGYIENRDGVFVIAQQSDNLKPTSGEKITLPSYQKIQTVNIYKALCKMALSIVDDNYIKHFDKTIAWLKEEKSNSVILPKVALNIIPHVVYDHPEIALYVRKNDNFELPFTVGEFKFNTLIFVFVIPFSDQDHSNFSDQMNYDKFWNEFKHYNKLNGWSYHSFDSVNPTPFQFSLNLQEREK